MLPYSAPYRQMWGGGAFTPPQFSAACRKQAISAHAPLIRLRTGPQTPSPEGEGSASINKICRPNIGSADFTYVQITA